MASLNDDSAFNRNRSMTAEYHGEQSEQTAFALQNVPSRNGEEDSGTFSSSFPEHEKLLLDSETSKKNMNNSRETCNNSPETLILEKPSAFSQQAAQPIKVPTFGKIALFVSGTLCFTLSISLPVSLSVMFLHWQNTFQVSRARTAAVHATCVGILFAGGVVPGYLNNKLGPRITSLLGTCLASTGLFLTYFATSIEYLIVTTGVISGFGFCMLQIPCIPSVVAHFTEYRSIVISTILFVCGLGGIVLPYFNEEMIHYYGWRGAFLIISGLALNTAVFGLIMTSSLPTPTSKKLDVAIVSKDETNLQKTASGEKELTKENPNTIWKTAEKGSNEYASKTAIDKENDNKLREIDSPIDELPSKDADENTLFLTSGSNVDGVNNDETLPYRELNKPTDSKNQQKKSYKNIFVRIKASKWKFLVDPLAIIFNLNIAMGLGSFFSFLTLQMDFAQTAIKGSESDGLTFIMSFVAASLAGRLIAGFVNLIPHCHSVLIMSFACIMAGGAMIALGSVTKFLTAIVFLLVMGLGVGALLASYPKVLLDLKSVGFEAFPLALGLTSTVEGIVDLIIPILIGLVVDKTESYFIPLTVFGIISVVEAVLFIIVWLVQQRRDRKKTCQEKA